MPGMSRLENIARAHDKILFDFADIERYDPDGTDFLDLGTNDNCDYSGGNWAIEWCSANPGSDLCASCSCAHSQPLNCNLKARAFWWMMARLAGWNPVITTSTTTSIGPSGTDCEGNFDCDQDCDGSDAVIFAVNFGRNSYNRPCTSSDPCNGDFECDGDCDGTDAANFKQDFGRSAYSNSCPVCEVGDWCVY